MEVPSLFCLGGLQVSVTDLSAGFVRDVDVAPVAVPEPPALAAAELLPVESGPQAQSPVQMSAASASCAMRGDRTPRIIIVTLLHHPFGEAPVHCAAAVSFNLASRQVPAQAIADHMPE